MPSRYFGHVDQLSQAFVTGWAATPDRTPCSVTLFKNGKVLAKAPSNVVRDDLKTAGFPADAGFIYNFDPPLSCDDTIDIRFPDGEALPGSDKQSHKARLKELLTGINLREMRGIELGPLDRPIVTKSQSEVIYVDHASRKELVTKYATTERQFIDVAAIVDVDVIWKGGKLADALPAGEQFDYCIAAHVIEHVADPISWLAGLADILRPGGLISLAIPERNLTFDYRRDLTSPADLIDAYLNKMTRPGPRHVFDCVAFASPLDKAHYNLPLFDKAKLEHALLVARHAKVSEDYLDMHCNVFTLDSFKLCWEVISTLELVPLSLHASFEPRGDALGEFVVILRRS